MDGAVEVTDVDVADGAWAARAIDAASDSRLGPAADAPTPTDDGAVDAEIVSDGVGSDTTTTADSDAQGATDTPVDGAQFDASEDSADDLSDGDLADAFLDGAALPDSPLAPDLGTDAQLADASDVTPESAPDVAIAEVPPDTGAVFLDAVADLVDAAAGDAGPSDATPDLAAEVADPNKCPYGLSPKTLCLKWGVCAAGVALTCVGNSPVCDYGGVADYEEVEKSCDGLDNDCNQLVDDELPLPALPPAKGVCSSQKPQCAGAKGWLLPDYASLPGYQTQETACDGLDNDCDGKTDQFVKAPPLSTKPGVCGLALQVCAGKAGWAEPPLTAVAGYQPLESLCDGKDNDCDGQTDEDLGKTNPPDSGLGKPNLGVCVGAPLQCKGGKWVAPDYAAWSALAAAGTPTFEEVEQTCDGLDNDCNGIADDVAVPAPPASKAQGVCAGQFKVCAAAKGWQDPDFTKIGGYAAGPEVVCDGQDNDCDGKTDEDAACPRWQSGGKGNGRVALSPDGAQLAWLSATGVHVHNTLTGAHAYDHFGHRFGVEAVAFSPDGTRIASVGKIDALRVYYAAYSLGKPASWPLLLAIGKVNDHFTAVAWSADAKMVAVGTHNGMVLIIDAVSGAVFATLAPHNKPVRALALHSKAPGGFGVVSGGDDGKVQHMLLGAVPLQTLATLGSPVQHLRYDSASHRVVASAEQLAPRVFDLQSGKQLATLAGVPDAAGVQLAAGGSAASGITTSGQLWQWSLPNGIPSTPPALQPKPVADGPTGAPPDVAVDLALAATHAYVGWQARGPARLQLVTHSWSWPVVRHVGAVFDLGAQDGVLWSAAALGVVGSWSAATGKPDGMYALHTGDVLTLALAQPSGQPPLLVTAATDYSVRVWQLAQPAQATSPINVKTFGLGGPWARDLAVGSGAVSVWAAAGSGAHLLGIAPATLGQKLQVYAVGLGASVRKVAPSPNGQWLMVALDGAGPANGDHVRMLDAGTLQVAWQRKDLAADESAIAFRPQGDLVAVGGGSAGLVLLDSKTGETLAVLAGHSGPVRALDWAADGTRLLSTSNDGTARVWLIAADKAPLSLVSMTRHCPDGCAGVAVTAGIWGDAAGSYAITASDDGAIIGWDAPTAP